MWCGRTSVQLWFGSDPRAPSLPTSPASKHQTSSPKGPALCWWHQLVAAPGGAEHGNPGPSHATWTQSFHPRTFLTATTDGDEGNQSSSQSQECQKGLKQPAQTLSAHRSAPGCCRWFGAILALRARLLHAPTRPLRAAVLQHDRVREALDPSPSQQPQINAGEFPQGRCDFNLQGLGEAAQRPDTCWLKPIVRLRPLLL